MDFEYVITRDEFWFYSHNPSDAAWAVSRDELPEWIKRKIDTGKGVISVFWSINGIHHLIGVPSGMKYNSSFSCDVVMPDLIQNITSKNRRKTVKIFFIHLDNVCRLKYMQFQECIQASEAKCLPHPV
jgi:hypothetical protein